jgi:hypothetical protein
MFIEKCQSEQNQSSYINLRRLIQATLFTSVVPVLMACGSTTESNATQVATNETTINDVAINNAASNNVQNSQSAAIANATNTTPNSRTTDNPLLRNVSATVYKDVNCGCCEEWIEYAEGHGMQSQVQHPADITVFKDRYQVPQQMRSCHTAVTQEGYVFEGHVPAKYMAQFLAKPPVDAIGLAVPNMPMGSPGMEYQGQFDPYNVMQLNKDGTSSVYASIESEQQQL